MFKNKLKKVAGAIAVAGALLLSGAPASAAPDLTPIRDKYPDAYQFQWNGDNTVTVFFRDSQGKSYDITYTCVVVTNGTCYVYK
ncbi:LacI family transcriptional regulator [Bacillus sp. CLL-7-23]|uniref:LacI family transcriptional regulator n=1 Tax=Bacillus changyiensis TaxID=3004103 RepID=A0ABT4WZZ0_9BACI|nr:LacI family transcriptional regulator [Bacillus changyiensis]MDA7025593.1 LacI family transcriptional regulator [Bacillus changyiensis]